MPTFLVTDPKTGRQLRLTGESPPTEQELEQLFASQSPAPAQQQSAEHPAQEEGGILPTLETVGTIASGIVAEPLAGIAGIAQSLNPFADEGAGARAVEATREALTFQGGEESQQQLQNIGEFVEPVAEKLGQAEDFLGDTAFELTGSPAIAAAAKTLPTAVLELIGFKGAKKLTQAGKVTKKQVKQAIVESAPEVEQLKNVTRGVYKEIDEAGVRIKKQPFDNLINKIDRITKKKGLDRRVTTQAAGAMEVLKESKGINQTLGELDTLRNVAANVAKNTDKVEAALGNIMISEIDNFLDTMKATDTLRGTAAAADVSKKYKVARKLWGRARRAELIEETIVMGKSRAAGAEAGIRNELNNLINNKRKSKFFPKDEITAMRRVVNGNFAQNFTRMIGKVGVSVDRSPNVLGALIGGGGVGFGLGGGTASLVPAITVSIGTASKAIARKLTTGKANFVGSITRAGKDGNKIAKAYLQSVPKAKRNIKDLADLLSDPDIDLDSLQFIADRTTEAALEIAKGRRAINLASAAFAGAQNQQIQGN